MMQAQAVVFTAPETVELRPVSLPDPTPRDIVVEMETSGVSVGTERWTYLGKRSEIRFPNVPGYIGVGRVAEVGAEAAKRGYAVGEKVIFSRSRLAGDVDGTSWMSTHLSRAVIDVTEAEGRGPDDLDVHHCEKLPPGLDPAEAALAILGSVAMRGIEMATIRAGATVLVAGMGVIGQFAAQIARLKGARVAATDVVAARLETARENGADWVIHSKDEDLEKRAREIAPRGFDVIIDTSSIPAVVNRLVPLLRMRGQFIFQGWYPPPSPLDLNAFHFRLPTCYFPCAYTGTATAAVMRWMAAGQLRVKNLVTLRARPEEAPEVYRRIAAGSDGFLGVVFDWRKKA